MNSVSEHSIKTSRKPTNKKLRNNGALNRALEADNLMLFEKLALEAGLDLEDPPTTNLDYTILLLRYYLMKDLFDRALKYFMKMQSKFQPRMRKRYINLILAGAAPEDRVALFLKYSAPYYESDGFDLGLMPGSLEVLKTMLHRNVHATVKYHGWSVVERPECLKMLHMSEDDKLEVKSAFKKHLKRHQVPSFKNKIKYVIDGANVLFFKHRKITIDGFIQLNSVIMQLLRVVRGDELALVLHQRHFKSSSGSSFGRENTLLHKFMIDSWKTAIQVVQTPRGVDDDIYSISIAVDNDGYIVTNDQFRDHVNHISPKLRIWRDEHGIGYDWKSDGIQLHDTPELSRRVQMVQGRDVQQWLVPYVNSAGQHGWLLRTFPETRRTLDSV